MQNLKKHFLSLSKFLGVGEMLAWEPIMDLLALIGETFAKSHDDRVRK